MAKSARIDDDGNVFVTIALTTSGCPLRAQIQRDVRARVGGLPGVAHVKIEWTEMTREEKSSAMAKAQIGRASRRESVCQYVWISVVAVSFTKKQTRVV